MPSPTVLLQPSAQSRLYAHQECNLLPALKSSTYVSVHAIFREVNKHISENCQYNLILCRFLGNIFKLLETVHDGVLETSHDREDASRSCKFPFILIGSLYMDPVAASQGPSYP